MEKIIIKCSQWLVIRENIFYFLGSSYTRHRSSDEVRGLMKYDWMIENYVPLLITSIDTSNVKFSLQFSKWVTNYAPDSANSLIYANPFNPTTSISFDVAVRSNVKPVIYDILGREVRTLLNESKAPGSYSVVLDASNLPSGVYFYKMIAGSFVQTRKLVVVK